MEVAFRTKAGKKNSCRNMLQLTRLIGNRTVNPSIIFRLTKVSQVAEVGRGTIPHSSLFCPRASSQLDMPE